MSIEHWAAQAVGMGASDLHLSAGVPPMVRIDGDLTRLSEAVLSHEEIHQAVVGLMNPIQQAHFKDTMECDFSIEIPQVSRFRVNAFHQARGVSVAGGSRRQGLRWAKPNQLAAGGT